VSVNFIDNAVEFAKRREAEQAPKKKRVKPRKDWVLIKKVEPKDILHPDSGILETRGNARSQMGRVVAVSLDISDLIPGDLVIYTNFPMELEDIEELTQERNLHLIQNEEVYAVLEDVE